MTSLVYLSQHAAHHSHIAVFLVSAGAGLMAGGAIALLSALVPRGRLENFPSARQPFRLIGISCLAAGAVMLVTGLIVG
jgi:hypothetical protein